MSTRTALFRDCAEVVAVLNNFADITQAFVLFAGLLRDSCCNRKLAEKGRAEFAATGLLSHRRNSHDDKELGYIT